MIGIQLTQAGLNQIAGTCANNLRDACYAIGNLQAQVVALGQPGLVALGFTAADAQALTNVVNYLNTVAAIFQGTAAQPTPFNFQNAVAPVNGAQ